MKESTGLAMKMFVYGMREYDEKLYFDKFSKRYGIEYEYTTEYPALHNVHLAKGFDALNIITNPLEANLLDAFKEAGVRYIATRTIGYEHIAIAHAREIGLRVCHVEYSPNSVANYTIMMMLMGCRKILHILQREKMQDFSLQGKIGMEISNCTIGVIGTGKIGETVIRHLSGFGCRILAYDTYEKDNIRQTAQYVDLDTLYKESHIITLHVPALPENYHMIDKAAFDRMKDGVVLINAARGMLIDTQALIHNLEIGKVGFAGLDTIEHEEGLYYTNRVGDIISNHERAILSAFPNVMISPHTAFYTEEAVSDMVENSIRGILAFEQKGCNPYEV